jgi:hypothetical protein
VAIYGPASGVGGDVNCDETMARRRMDGGMRVFFLLMVRRAEGKLWFEETTRARGRTRWERISTTARW